MALAGTKAPAARAVVGGDGAALEELLVAGCAEVVVAAVALEAVVAGRGRRDRVGAIVAVGGDCEWGVFGVRITIAGIGGDAVAIGLRSRHFRMEGGC